MNTAKRLSTALNAAVSTVANGITMRGKCILRTRLSRFSTAVTEAPVASWKYVISMMFNSSSTG